MPLILAIESDQRQAGHLVHIVRRRLGAELILAETFEAALPSIGTRAPDLILVPALLSPEDDASLKFVLRAIADGSHVQVLTTPAFGARSPSPARRLLPGFLRPRTARAVDGCDPEEFARHIASYLETSARKRAMPRPPVIDPAVPDYQEAPVDLPAPVGPATAQPARVDVPAASPPPGPERAADEWGLFDPSQCGIEALLLKLRQMTDDEWKAETVEPEVSPR